MPLTGTFIQGRAGRLLTIVHEPEHGSVRRSVIVVPAFGDEMNKSRRLVWHTAQRLAAAGCRTIVPDLYGTGDSEGNFVDARWETWTADLERIVSWAREQGAPSLGVLLVRHGATLFAALEQRLDVRFERAVAWQPVERGDDAVRQMLRTKNMSMRMAGERAPSVADLQEELVHGMAPVELGGYLWSPALAQAVHHSRFVAEDTVSVNEGMIVDFKPAAADPLRPAPEPRAGAWRRRTVAGERFWQVVEPGPNEPLVLETAAFLSAR